MQRVAAVPPQAGQHIFAYCNVRTNQVLYSLDRFLKPRHLEQLPDIGANHKPPSLRKDTWRPLWSVTLPPTEDGRLQGLDAFKKLRDYRKLHELCWEPTEEMKRQYSEKEIQELQKRLDERGGSKRETVWDLIKRKKHKIRLQIIMDQKANSIADLAAVLLGQEEKGVAIEKASSAARAKQLAALRKLAQDASYGMLQWFSRQLKSTNLEKSRATTGQLKRKFAQRASELELQIERMQFAQNAFASVKEEYMRIRSMLSKGSTDSPPSSSPKVQDVIQCEERLKGVREGGKDSSKKGPDNIYYRLWLPSFPNRLLPTDTEKRKPIYLAKGVTIRWAHLLDAEYARLWPEEVVHEQMFQVRHSHPSLDQAASSSKTTVVKTGRHTPKPSDRVSKDAPTKTTSSKIQTPAQLPRRRYLNQLQTKLLKRSLSRPLVRNVDVQAV